MSGDILRASSADGILTLTLSRPEKRNALNRALVEALTEALARAQHDGEVRVVAIRGAGRDFCAGADLAELERISDMGSEESLEDARRLGALFSLMRTMSKPVVAVVHGRALAGGCGLATACDAVLAHEDAELGYPEIHLGFVPAMVMTMLRRKVGEGHAFDLVTRGHRVDASLAREIGLVTRVFDADRFETDVARHLAELAGMPPTAVALTKGLLYELDELGFEEGIERGAQVNVQARMSDACRDGVRRFLDRSDSKG
jgi:methylglutaconyl-CoA hydratase